MYNLITAVMLLISPNEYESQVEVSEPLMQTMQKVAIKMEILDPRETRYILFNKTEFTDDLSLLRKRYQTLKDAPRLSDTSRFPDRFVCSDMLEFNRAYRSYLNIQANVKLSHQEEIGKIIQEAGDLYDVWDAVRDAGCEYYYVTVRRQALKRVKDLIGPEAYYSGTMPPVIPIWYFNKGE